MSRTGSIAGSPFSGCAFLLVKWQETETSHISEKKRGHQAGDDDDDDDDEKENGKKQEMSWSCCCCCFS